MHSSGPTSTPSSTVEGQSQSTTTTKPKRRAFSSHLRRLSQPVSSKDRSPSAYEAWIENALHLAHTPEAPREELAIMVRGRSESTPHGGDSTGARRNASNSGASNLHGLAKDEMPTIKLIPHQDPRSSRPSLAFPPTTRTLPHEDCVIRVGRYSERDVNPNPSPNTPSAAPVGFKSKVVSRRHCEFWCSQGQWYIKDMKSSSGTFLNHIRLSQPSIESRPFPVNDGDVVQLGIDFRGGEEMIFRCVKIRVECNRGWQKTLNNYNMSTHKRLRELGKALPKNDSDTASVHSSQECSICLMSIAPCQSLFVAPCSHVWHYKCIRPILNDHKSWPQFLCPNCRAVTDLDAELDDPLDRWEDEEDLPDLALENANESDDAIRVVNGTPPIDQEDTQVNRGINGRSFSISGARSAPVSTAVTPAVDIASDPMNEVMPPTGIFGRRTAAAGEPAEIRLPSGSMQFLRPIIPSQPLMGDNSLNRDNVGTPTLELLNGDGPMTPTNNAGPFVFDGSAGRSSGGMATESRSENPSAAA